MSLRDLNYVTPPVSDLSALDPKKSLQVLADGGRPEPVECIRGPVAGLRSCRDDRHCCAHGSGPVFSCCRCGSQFKFGSRS